MTRLVQLERYADLLKEAQERLSVERGQIFALYPLPADYNREAYGFAYLRAERLGMGAINRRLMELSWLPVQLDTSPETVAENRHALKRWLKDEAHPVPNSDNFGNDFVHAMTRCALKHGWPSPQFQKLVSRTSQLFSDLSCLVGIVYYSNWMMEQGISVMALTDPHNLALTAMEFTTYMKLAEAAHTSTQPPSPQPKPSNQSGKAKPNLKIISTIPLTEADHAPH